MTVFAFNNYIFALSKTFSIFSMSFRTLSIKIFTSLRLYCNVCCRTNSEISPQHFSFQFNSQKRKFFEPVLLFTLSLFTMLSLAGCSTKASKSDNASTMSSNASQTASEVTTTSKTNLKDSNSENTLDTSVNMLDSEESTFETHSLSSSSNQEPTNNSENYYQQIKDAWQKEKDYVEAIEDPKLKQSVQTPSAAANAMASKLEMENPADSKIIESSLQKVLAGQ